MTEIYKDFQELGTELLRSFNQGEVLLTRVYEDDPDPNKPWAPPDSISRTYRLAATVRGVSSKYIDGTNIVVSDQMVVCAVSAELIAASDIPINTFDDIHPTMEDSLMVDGTPRTIKAIKPVPAAGEPSVYHIVIGG